eukprot:TRINITY_DN1182_c0_g1_i1.p1 TRINITY_DN1182_c0_g1~~TRINITY_DN1182_c0_g1_i1.p1  ORF type:complete len:689 (-),score=246.85 TRINITY_DN1182_c0_g1_i1:71-2137(-)
MKKILRIKKHTLKNSIQKVLFHSSKIRSNEKTDNEEESSNQVKIKNINEDKLDFEGEEEEFRKFAEGLKVPDFIGPYAKYTSFSKGEKRYTYSQDNAYYEEIRKNGETSSEDEIQIRRDLVEEVDGELVRKEIDPSLLKFQHKFKNSIKKKRGEEEIIAQYKDNKLVRKPHPLKHIEDLKPEDFTASEEELRTDPDEVDNRITEASEGELAPRLNERRRRQALESLQYGDFDLREEIYKDAPFHEKPLSIQHSTILKETQKLMPKREKEFNQYFDKEKINIDDVLDIYFGEDYVPEKLENFFKLQNDLSNENNEQEIQEDVSLEDTTYYSNQRESEYVMKLDDLFFQYAEKALNYQLKQLENFTDRKATKEEYNELIKRAVDIGREATQSVPLALDINSHPEALEQQFIHSLDLAFQKVKEYNPTLIREELDDDNYVPRFNKEAVVAEAIQNVEEVQFNKQWEVVQTLRKGKLPTYLNFYLSLYDLRFKKFYPKIAKRWVEYAKTPRGYFGRDAEWHTITKKELKLLNAPSKLAPTLYTDLFQTFNPNLPEDLQKGYRFGFLQSEVDSIPNLSPKLKDLLSLQYAYPKEIQSYRIFNEVNLWKRHPLDTGSAEIQVAVFTVRLNHLAEHVKKHKKDHKTKIAVRRITNRRKVMMTYLKKRNVRKYFEVMYHLKIADYGKFHWNTSWPC